MTDPTAPDAEPMSLSALLATGDLNGKHEAHALIGEANKKIAESPGKLAPLRVPAAAADDDGEAVRCRFKPRCSFPASTAAPWRTVCLTRAPLYVHASEPS